MSQQRQTRECQEFLNTSLNNQKIKPNDKFVNSKKYPDENTNIYEEIRPPTVVQEFQER